MFTILSQAIFGVIQMGDKRIIEVETIQAGQPRPYADHIYESYITFSVPEGQMWARKWGTHESTVKQFIPLLVGGYSENPEWHDSRLEKLEQVSPGRWHVIVIQPFID